MSKTLIECEDPKLLTGFMHGALFFTGARVDYDPDFTWVLVENDDLFDNQTYTLTEDGLVHKDCGAVL